MKHPSVVSSCNLELENLITDSNRSIATLAITTLLKVCINFSSIMFFVCLFVPNYSSQFFQLYDIGFFFMCNDLR
jgi:hypothetical protein